jgi:hypothetical protein
MKKIFALTILLIITAIGAGAQAPKTYVEIGALAIHSTAYDPSDSMRKDGGQTFLAPYVAAAYDLRHSLQARFLAEYLPKPTLNSIFTSDTDIGRRATSELRIRSSLRAGLVSEGPIRPFVEAGAERLQQFFKPTRPKTLPDPLPPLAYSEYSAQEGSVPTAAINPFLTFGAEIGEYHEAGFTRLFEDQATNSQLSGYRANYSYTHPLSRRISLRAGLEADFVRFRDSIGNLYIANYSKHDLVAKIRVAFLIH